MEASGHLHAPASLPPGKELLLPIGIGGWVGPRAVLDADAGQVHLVYALCVKNA
jgi:hypothetical protein